ncbi:MAG: substrate-binding domain-containing protein [Synergistaceae bacterium]|jgi:inositol transport system substrate-binding protein|nr:substrate-binding domain-containing protein [Synergistaceae bacterium]
MKQKMKKRMFTVFLAVCSILALGLASGTEAFAATAKFKIGYSCNNFNDTFQTYIVDAARAAAVEAGVDLEVLDAQEDDIRQQDQVNNLIQNGVDALIVVPVNTGSVQPIIKAAADAKKPLVFVNRNPYPSGGMPENVYFTGADSILEGSSQMEYAGKLMGGKGNICILMGILSNEGALGRTAGIEQTVQEKFPDIKILAKETGNWQRDQGLNITENWLTAYGEQINAILSNNDEMALGAIMALENAGRQDVLVFGNDAIPDALAAIKSGKLGGTVLQDPVAQGKGSLEITVKILNGEKVEQLQKLPADVINKDNINNQ